MGAWNGRRFLKVSAGLMVGASLLAWGGWHATLAWSARDFTAHFKEPAAGPRAPHSRIMGLQVGRTTLTEGTAAAAALGITCMDTSTRAMMQGIRERKEKAFWERIKRGEFKRSEPAIPDGYGKRLLGYMANPQVRLACDTKESVMMTGGSAYPGRWLQIYDAEDLPLRHSSFRMDLKDPTEAAARFNASVAEFTALYGAPHKVEGHLGKTEDGRDTLPSTVINKASWDWTDLHVEVSALWFGPGRGAGVEKRVEVPMGIRPDAPALGPASLVATGG